MPAESTPPLPPSAGAEPAEATFSVQPSAAANSLALRIIAVVALIFLID